MRVVWNWIQIGIKGFFISKNVLLYARDGLEQKCRHFQGRRKAFNTKYCSDFENFKAYDLIIGTNTPDTLKYEHWIEFLPL